MVVTSSLVLYMLSKHIVHDGTSYADFLPLTVHHNFKDLELHDSEYNHTSCWLI